MEEQKYLCTDTEKIPKMVQRLRNNYYASSPTSISYRINQLKQLIKFIDECGDDLIEACLKYYGGSKTEHWNMRLWIIKSDCYNVIKNLKEWMKPIKKPQNFPLSLMWNAKIEYHSLGVVTVIAPWNYPINLLLRPLIGAIAAGNAVIVKPSEITDDVARVFQKKLLNYLDSSMIQVICGGANETTILLKQKLDFVLFTGGGKIGKIIMKSCSNQLIPCCLELGGKNPVIIDDNADLDLAIKRIVYGRFDWNGGQICVAPEYIMISKSKQEKAIEIIKKYLTEWYGDNGDTINSGSYMNIVNNLHFDRINKIRKYYLENKSEKVAVGGINDKQFGPNKVNKKIRHLPPFVVKDIDFNNDKIMENEVFGPILSIIPMDGNFNEWIDDSIKYIRSTDKPLVFYIFTKTPQSKNILKLRNSISAGTISINDTVMFMGLKDFPFGGVGEAGMGRYGGKYSFITFSQEKPIAIRTHGLEFLNNDRYPDAKLSKEQIEKKRKKMKQVYEGLYEKPESKTKSVLKYSILVSAIVAFAYYYKKFYNK